MTISLRPCTKDDYEFAFEAKKQALGPCVAERWGWDDAVQREVHSQRWAEKPWSLILRADEPVGTISLENVDERWRRLGEFYLLDGFRGQGIGSQLLKTLLTDCDRSRRWVRLEYLRWNRVGSLYARFGFRIIGENETHYFLERSPRPETPSA
ncbi:MAG: GNAT family N-acetyltransferase [Pseudomonadota bacterium]